ATHDHHTSRSGNRSATASQPSSPRTGVRSPVQKEDSHMTEDIRVAVVGAGLMGTDHIRRITTRTTGAVIAAIVEPDRNRAAAAAALAPGASVRTRFDEALELDSIDAVIIATPAAFHEPVIFPALDAGIAILCEKPLTDDSESALRILDAEQRLSRPHIQVGFMRRFDAEYQQLKALIDSGDAGALLALHCAHRNPSAPPSATTAGMIIDSVAHELDIVPWLAGSPLASIEVRFPRRNSLAADNLRDPQLILLETESGVLADVEMSVNIQFGYQVRTEGVFERGVAEIGRPSGLAQWRAGSFTTAEHATFETRFAGAYDVEVQRWIDATRRGQVDGPNAWDGYLVAVAAEAGVLAQTTGSRVEIKTVPKPAFYGAPLSATAEAQ
ncbi:MAG: Gfo/Idh/MocA family oxidoreductase, partial [Glaciihabitans sp.]|nr:Gfo/Idh/MocA family oxidoreductase [Glaciihabitans sp.]